MFPFFPTITITTCQTHIRQRGQGFDRGTTVVTGVTADGTTVTIRGRFGGADGWSVVVRRPGDNFTMTSNCNGWPASRTPDRTIPFRGNDFPSHRDGGAWVDDGAGCVVFDPTA